MLIKKIKYFSLIFFYFFNSDNLHAINYNNTKIIENIKIEFDKSKNRAWIKFILKLLLILMIWIILKLFSKNKEKYSKKWFDCYIIYKIKI